MKKLLCEITSWLGWLLIELAQLTNHEGLGSWLYERGTDCYAAFDPNESINHNQPNNTMLQPSKETIWHILELCLTNYDDLCSALTEQGQQLPPWMPSSPDELQSIMTYVEGCGPFAITLYGDNESCVHTEDDQGVRLPVLFATVQAAEDYMAEDPDFFDDEEGYSVKPLSMLEEGDADFSQLKLSIYGTSSTQTNNNPTK
jgi:hypothetical protein